MINYHHVILGLGMLCLNSRNCLQKTKQLRELRLIEALFEQFDGYLRTRGYQATGGQIIDATLISVPKQHQKTTNNLSKRKFQQVEQSIQNGLSSLTWMHDGQHGWSYFGYKSHISIDVECGFTQRYAVTNASVPDFTHSL